MRNKSRRPRRYQCSALRGSQGFSFKDTLAGTLTLNATAAGLTSAAQNETIRAAPPSRLAIATAAQTLIAGACSAAVTAQAVDLFGNPSNVVSNTSVALSTTSAQGHFYSNATCTAQITNTAIAAGTSAISVYYRDTRTGTPTLGISNAGLSSPTQMQTVNPAPPSKIVFTSMPQVLTAGNCSAIAGIQAPDAFDNA